MRAGSFVSMTAALLGLSGSMASAGDFYVSIRPAGRPDGYGKVQLSKAALGSNPIRLWQNTSINPDCTPAGKPTLTLIKPPQHGQVQITADDFFYSFPEANPRSACNDRKVPGNRAFYTAADGYIGPDHVVLEGSSPEGYVRRIAIDIDVRERR